MDKNRAWPFWALSWGPEAVRPGPAPSARRPARHYAGTRSPGQLPRASWPKDSHPHWGVCQWKGLMFPGCTLGPRSAPGLAQGHSTGGDLGEEPWGPNGSVPEERLVWAASSSWMGPRWSGGALGFRCRFRFSKWGDWECLSCGVERPLPSPHPACLLSTSFPLQSYCLSHQRLNRFPGMEG